MRTPLGDVQDKSHNGQIQLRRVKKHLSLKRQLPFPSHPLEQCPPPSPCLCSHCSGTDPWFRLLPSLLGDGFVGADLHRNVGFLMALTLDCADDVLLFFALHWNRVEHDFGVEVCFNKDAPFFCGAIHRRFSKEDGVLTVECFHDGGFHTCAATDMRCVVPDPRRLDHVVVLDVQLGDGAEVLRVVAEEPVVIAPGNTRN